MKEEITPENIQARAGCKYAAKTPSLTIAAGSLPRENERNRSQDEDRTPDGPEQPVGWLPMRLSKLVIPEPALRETRASSGRD